MSSSSARFNGWMNWLIYAFVIALLTALGTLIVYQTHQQTRAQVQQAANDRMALLAITVSNELEDGRYDAIQPLFTTWGEKHPETVSIRLQNKKGFEFGLFKATSLEPDPIKLELQIDYGYRGHAVLSYQHSSSEASKTTQHTLVGVAVALLLITLLGAYLVFRSEKYHLQARHLAQLSEALKQRNHDLSAEDSLLHSVIDSLPDLIYFKGVDGRYRGGNKAFQAFYGLPSHNLDGLTDNELFAAEKAKTRTQRDQRIIDSQTAQSNMQRIRNAEGDEVLIDSLHTPYFDEEHNLLGMIGIGRDVTELHKSQEILETMAYRDELTGLPNRRYLIDRMQQNMAQADRHDAMLAVCTIDLDGFKPINDRYGHAMGDKVIVAFAARMAMMLREGDTVSRWGGDEFTILLTDIDDINACTQLLQRIMSTIREPFSIGDISVELTASVGVTLYPDDKHDADTLLRHADQAMYLSKQSGKNAYTFFDPEQDRSIHDQAQELSRLITAIESGELFLLYQPQIDMHTGELRGVEALVRWQHPEQGRLSPSKFLHLLENHPASIKLDWWALETTLTQLQQWHQHGIVKNVSVNISALTLQQNDFIGRLDELMKRYPCATGRLHLEILESSLLSNLDQVTNAIKAARGLGVEFALDDFGTGYSSLTYLRRLPAKTLKIDRSFIEKLLDNENDLKIVNGILRLAEAFEKKVIAEGVESTKHGEALLILGCRYAQGFGVANPMPGDVVESWATQYKLPKSWAGLAYST